jgi:hypothetical protein
MVSHSLTSFIRAAADPACIYQFHLSGIQKNRSLGIGSLSCIGKLPTDYLCQHLTVYARRMTPQQHCA